LPRDEHEAVQRRLERIRVITTDGEVSANGHWQESRPYTIDLRR
jgi:hypothetical protein